MCISRAYFPCNLDVGNIYVKVPTLGLSVAYSEFPEVLVSLSIYEDKAE